MPRVYGVYKRIHARKYENKNNNKKFSHIYLIYYTRIHIYILICQRERWTKNNLTSSLSLSFFLCLCFTHPLSCGRWKLCANNERVVEGEDLQGRGIQKALIFHYMHSDKPQTHNTRLSLPPPPTHPRLVPKVLYAVFDYFSTLYSTRSLHIRVYIHRHIDACRIHHYTAILFLLLLYTTAHSMRMYVYNTYACMHIYI